MPSVPVLGNQPSSQLPVHPQGVRATDQHSNLHHYFPPANPVPIVSPVLSPVVPCEFGNLDPSKNHQRFFNNVSAAPSKDGPNIRPNTKYMMKIVSVQNLPKKVGAFDRTDPMIEIRTPVNSYKTKVMKNAGSEATFNEITTLTVNSDRMVEIKVYDFNHIQKDILLCTGSFHIPETFEPNHILKVNLKHTNQQNQTSLGNAVATIELLGSSV